MNARMALDGALLVTVSLAATPLAAQNPAERGLAIVQEMEDRSRGYEDFEARLVMRILDGEGSERVREMSVRGLEAEGGDRTLIVLARPADLAGTAFLSVLGDAGERSQWIYLPTARRVRRIGGSRSSDSFLASHFTYGDMSPPGVEGFTYRWIRDQKISERDGALVERTRVAGQVDFPRELLWIDTERFLLHRVEFFDATGVRKRALDITDYQQIDGFWRAGRMEMSDADDGGSTVLEWSELRVGVGLRERDFDPARLGR